MKTRSMKKQDLKDITVRMGDVKMDGADEFELN